MSSKSNTHRALEMKLGMKVLKVFSGGSTAATVLVQGSSKSVIKIAETDGLNNGRRKLVRETNQIQHLLLKFGTSIQPYLPIIEAVKIQKNSVFVQYKYIENSQTIAEMIRDDSVDLQTIEKILTKILEIVVSFYESYVYKDNDFFRIKNLQRANFRTEYLAKHQEAFHSLLAQSHILINGKNFENASQIINRILADSELLSSLASNQLGECFHGDLNLRNILLREDQSLCFIDHRGSQQHWDIFYDLAKLLFTAGFDRIRNNDYLTEQLSSTSTTLTYNECTNPVHERWLSVAILIEQLISRLDSYKELRTKNPHWRLKLRMSFALHYLADSACRFVADSITTEPLASYLLGVIYLNQVVSDKYSPSLPQDFYLVERRLCQQ